jgi:2-polyprenyl-3-methyl-5-hydroxy-6-metoxy-1,4-benzoquinol methylase
MERLVTSLKTAIGNENFMTETTCNICSSRSVREQIVQPGLVYLCCSDCFYCEKKPELETIGADYVASQATYYENPEVDPFLEPQVVLNEKMRDRIGIAAAYLKANDRILEVGPGRGSFLAWAQSQSYACTACEQSLTLSSALRAKGFDIIEGEFEQLSITGQYDAVFSFHIIEHVTSPLAHLRQAMKLTKPGGYLILATPNAASWQQRLFPALSANFDTAHLHVLSEKSLGLLGEAAGWQPVRHSSAENVMGWLRLASKLLRRTRGEDESSTAGKYANLGASSDRVSMLIRLFALISSPLRWLQARLGGGSEVFVVFRKTASGATG